MACAPSTEDENFIEDVIDCFRDTVSTEDLQHLISEDEAWETVTKEAELTRPEADALRAALKRLITELLKVDTDRLQDVLKARKRFVDEFPQLKTELEKDIVKLRALADDIDKVHWDCSVTNVVASSTGTASGIMALIGLALAPFTAGTSLVLTGAGTALGVASGVTNVSTTIVEGSYEKEATKLISATMEKLQNFIKAVGYFPPKIFSLTENWKQFLKDLGKNIGVIKQAKGDRVLINNIKFLIKLGNIMVQGSKSIMLTAGRTAMLATRTVSILRAAKIFGAAASAVCLGLDVYNLVQDSAHLHEGAKSKLSEVVREEAQELENKLEDLSQTYEEWKSDLTQ